MKIILDIAIVSFGLLAGGMTLLATGLVPYWRGLGTAEFTRNFATSLPSVGGTMMVLTILATGSMVVAAALAFWKKRPDRAWLTAGAVAAVAMLTTVPLYFGAANPLLAGGTLGPEAITAELATWQRMHWLRTVVGILGFFCAVHGGDPQKSN